MVGVLFLILSILSVPSLASVRTISEGGRPIFWPNPRVIFTANPTNSSGLSDTSVDSLLSAAFASWMIPGSRVNISYLSNPNNGANSDYDGFNRVYFASHANRELYSNIVALTEVLYFVNSGQIAEADMVFNDNDFEFTSHEGDTGTAAASPYRSKIYLPDVATHESGHALGLDHSNVNLSPLFYVAFNGQYSIGADEANMILNMYPVGTSAGAISGTVRGTGGGIFGTQVSAINLNTGKIQAAILANADGTFILRNLPDASYSILMEPFRTGVDTVSAYYKNVNHRFCSSGNLRFERNFYGPCGTSNTAAVVAISGGNSINLNTLSPTCSSITGPTPAGSLPAFIPGTPKQIPAKGATFGTLDDNYYRDYILRNVSGTVKARAIAYSLFSPADVALEFLDSTTYAHYSGSTTTQDNVQATKPGGGPNYDSYAAATVSGAPTDLILRVSANAAGISGNSYPGGFQLVDPEGFYLLSLALNDDYGAAAPIDMAACSTVPNTPQEPYFRNSAPTYSETKTGCGSLGGPGASGGPGGGLTLLFASAFLAQGYFWASRRRKALQLVRRRR